MSLDAFLGKPSPIPPTVTQVPEREDAPEPDDLVDTTMSIQEFQRAMRMINKRKLKMDILGGEVGSGRMVTARNTLLTGV